MKKRIWTLLAALVCIFALTGCKKEETKEVTVDPTQLVTDLSATVTSSTLSAVSTEVRSDTYMTLDAAQIDNITASLNSGTGACEIAVITCKDASYAEKATEQLQSYLDSRADLFAGYAPDEVPKIEEALIKSAGNYVVLCVTDDTAAAEEVLKKAGF